MEKSKSSDTQQTSNEGSTSRTECEESSRTHRRQSSTARAILKPIPGFVWNPLRTLPRNMRCPCRSGRKFKACCLPNLPPAVSEEDAKGYREQMSKADLFFLTKDNEHLLESK